MIFHTMHLNFFFIWTPCHYKVGSAFFQSFHDVLKSLITCALSAVTSFGSEPAGNSNTDPPPEDASPPDFKEQLKSQPRRPAADAAAAAAPEIHTTESSPTPVHRKQAKVEFPGTFNCSFLSFDYIG